MLNKQQFLEDGYLHLPNFFDSAEVEKIQIEAKTVFLRQMNLLGLTAKTSIATFSEEEFNVLLFQFFEQHLERYIACGKNVQHLISLHKFALQDKITDALVQLGLEHPSICTRPVMFFNARKLAKKQVYWKTDAHQDWRSMQGSVNSMVLWFPMMDIDIKLGALEIIPQSHKLGLVADKMVDSFGTIPQEILDQHTFVPVEVKRGDALFFSSFLIHQSGDNSTENGIRWSCHFRYNDLAEDSFIERGYPHPYVYMPDSKILTENFPKEADIQKAFAG
jgi:phytanoyl-CoA hydroxylase